MIIDETDMLERLMAAQAQMREAIASYFGELS